MSRKTLTTSETCDLVNMTNKPVHVVYKGEETVISAFSRLCKINRSDIPSTLPKGLATTATINKGAK